MDSKKVTSKDLFRIYTRDLKTRDTIPVVGLRHTRGPRSLVGYGDEEFDIQNLGEWEIFFWKLVFFGGFFTVMMCDSK